MEHGWEMVKLGGGVNGQQVCKAGDFWVVEIDAKIGGYRIVPEDLKEAIVSSHYFLYDMVKVNWKEGFGSSLLKPGITLKTSCD